MQIDKCNIYIVYISTKMSGKKTDLPDYSIYNIVKRFFEEL